MYWGLFPWRFLISMNVKHTDAQATINPSEKPLLLYHKITQISGGKGDFEMNIPLARQSCQENHDQLWCTLKQHSVGFRGVTTAEWCFPDSVSRRRNTSIMDLISSVKILARFFTSQAKSMQRTAPCVFSCHIETKMTPIMPMKSGLSAVLGSFQPHQCLWDSQMWVLWLGNEDKSF